MSLRSVLLVVSACAASTAIATSSSMAAPAAATKSAAGSATAAAGSAAGSGSAMPNPDDEPPKDMNGVDENPDNAKVIGGDETKLVVAPKPKPTGYPVEEVLRPITLPKNMTELSIGPHFEVDDQSRQGFASSDVFHARYGITSRVQVAVSWLWLAIYPDPAAVGQTMTGAIGLHSGKAVGFDVTVRILDWLAVRAGMPIYVSPDAVSLTLGAPIKAVFFDKLALGGLEEIFNIKLDRFAPQFYQEYDNALAAFQTQNGGNNTVQAAGYFTISGFAEYQYDHDLAILGRIGVQTSLSSTGMGFAGSGVPGSSETFLHVGLQWTPRPRLDLGFTLGFDDLGHAGTFGPAGILAFRL
jgi:hypothetical protein